MDRFNQREYQTVILGALLREVKAVNIVENYREIEICTPIKKIVALAKAYGAPRLILFGNAAA